MGDCMEGVSLYRQESPLEVGTKTCQVDGLFFGPTEGHGVNH